MIAKFARNPAWQWQAEEWKKERAKRFPTPPPPKERREASIDAFRQFTRIVSYAVSSMGCSDPEGYDEVLPSDADDLTLARHARAALAASRFVLPDHPDYDGLIGLPTQEIDILEARDFAEAGVKTRQTLYRDAGSVSLMLQDGDIEVAPHRYLRGGAWEGIRGARTVLAAGVSDEELCAAILDALATSRDAR